MEKTSPEPTGTPSPPFVPFWVMSSAASSVTENPFQFPQVSCSIPSPHQANVMDGLPVAATPSPGDDARHHHQMAPRAEDVSDERNRDRPVPSAPVIDNHDDLIKEVECPICLQVYNTTSRLPKHLPTCSHVLCLKCLGRLQRPLRCPLCLHPVTFPDAGPAAFNTASDVQQLARHTQSKGCNLPVLGTADLQKEIQRRDDIALQVEARKQQLVFDRDEALASAMRVYGKCFQMLQDKFEAYKQGIHHGHHLFAGRLDQVGFEVKRDAQALKEAACEMAGGRLSDQKQLNASLICSKVVDVPTCAFKFVGEGFIADFQSVLNQHCTATQEHHVREFDLTTSTPPVFGLKTTVKVSVKDKNDCHLAHSKLHITIIGPNNTIIAERIRFSEGGCAEYTFRPRYMGQHTVKVFVCGRPLEDQAHLTFTVEPNTPINSAGSDLLTNPIGLSCSSNQVLVSDASHKKLFKFKLDSNATLNFKDSFSASSNGSTAQYSVGDLSLSGQGTVAVPERKMNCKGVSRAHAVTLLDISGGAIGRLKDSSRFGRAEHVAFDSFGNLLISDAQHAAIYIYETRDGFHFRFLRKIGNKNHHALLTEPTHICSGSGGDIVVVDAASNTVKVMDQFGALKTELGKGVLSSPSGVAADTKGHVLVSDSVKACVTVFKVSSGEVVNRLEGGGMKRPQGVGVLPDGLAVVCDRGSQCLRLFKYM